MLKTFVNIGFDKVDLELTATQFQVLVKGCYLLFIGFPDFVRGEFDFPTAFEVDKNVGAV